MKGKNDQSSADTQSVAKYTSPEVNTDLIMKRLEELESRFTQVETTLEASLKNTVTFENLAVRLTGDDKKSKTRKRTRTKRDWSPEEKAAFHKRMVAARLAKEKARQEAAKAEARKK
jgi:hypothetical protein